MYHSKIRTSFYLFGSCAFCRRVLTTVNEIHENTRKYVGADMIYLSSMILLILANIKWLCVEADHWHSRNLFAVLSSKCSCEIAYILI